MTDQGDQVVRPAGIEPATHGLENRCSIQLSYGRKIFENIGATGFEPATSCSQSKRSSQAELRPVITYSRLGPSCPPQSAGGLVQLLRSRLKLRPGNHSKKLFCRSAESSVKRCSD